MTTSPPVIHVDIHIPLTATEQVFLQLAVQAAAKRFRELQATGSILVEPPSIKPTRNVQHAE